MHVLRISIKNIKSLGDLVFDFRPNDIPTAGWHVIIGDNGSGKSTLVRAIALGLFGPSDAAALRQPFEDWIQIGKEQAKIDLAIKQHPNYDKKATRGANPKNWLIGAGVSIERVESTGVKHTQANVSALSYSKLSGAKNYLWSNADGWFSTSFGPHRRFSGGDKELTKLYYTNPRLAAHLSAFGENVALTEATEWLTHLYLKSLENRPEGAQLKYFKDFLNHGDLLPHGTILDYVSSEGVFFKDSEKKVVEINQLSDGFRSILSLIFELLRQMVNMYGASKVFAEVINGKYVIDLPGIVLIDEIDAHLHPTWQARIGFWFTSHFPNIQFIVTTHSPLICRASTKGSVWRLRTPSSEIKSGRVKGTELDRLLYGNVLEAYDTEVFGSNLTRSDAGHDLLDELARLKKLSVTGKISDKQKIRLEELRKIFAIERPTV